MRAGKELETDLPVAANRTLLIPNLAGAYPSYFVYGPLVFSAATMEFFSGFTHTYAGATWMTALSAAGSPLIKRMGERPGFPGEELVLVSSPFFPHKLAKGYSNPISQVVRSVNGTRIKNLNHLVEVLRDSKEQFITIEYDSRYGETPVFPRAEMVAATDDILNDNGLRSQGSPDAMSVWDGKRPK
jgi:hypothetical protein